MQETKVTFASSSTSRFSEMPGPDLQQLDNALTASPTLVVPRAKRLHALRRNPSETKIECCDCNSEAVVLT